MQWVYDRLGKEQTCTGPQKMGALVCGLGANESTCTHLAKPLHGSRYIARIFLLHQSELGKPDMIQV